MTSNSKFLFELSDFSEYIDLSRFQFFQVLINGLILTIATDRYLILSDGFVDGPNIQEANIRTVLEFSEDSIRATALYWITEEIICVGFESGFIVCFNCDGVEVFEFRGHKSPVQSIKVSNSDVNGKGPGVWILYESGFLVSIPLSQVLKGKSADLVSFKFSDHGMLSDFVFLHTVYSTSLFDLDEGNDSASHSILVGGMNSALSLYNIGGKLHFQDFDKLTGYVKEKVTGMITKSVMSLFSWGSSSSSSNTATDSKNKTEKGDESSKTEEKAITISSLVDFQDTKRRILRLSIDPYGQYVAAADSLGRVTLFDTQTNYIVRLWKGLRDARLSWVHAPEEDHAQNSNSRSQQSSIDEYTGMGGNINNSSGGNSNTLMPPRPPSTRSPKITHSLQSSDEHAIPTGLCIVIYAPQLGLVSIYRMVNGPCLRIIPAGLQSQLISSFDENIFGQRIAKCFLLRAIVESNGVEMTEINPVEHSESDLDVATALLNEHNEDNDNTTTTLLTGLDGTNHLLTNESDGNISENELGGDDYLLQHKETNPQLVSKSEARNAKVVEAQRLQKIEQLLNHLVEQHNNLTRNSHAASATSTSSNRNVMTYSNTNSPNISHNSMDITMKYVDEDLIRSTEKHIVDLLTDFSHKGFSLHGLIRVMQLIESVELYGNTHSIGSGSSNNNASTNQQHGSQQHQHQQSSNNMMFSPQHRGSGSRYSPSVFNFQQTTTGSYYSHHQTPSAMKEISALFDTGSICFSLGFHRKLNTLLNDAINRQDTKLPSFDKKDSNSIDHSQQQQQLEEQEDMLRTYLLEEIKLRGKLITAYELFIEIHNNADDNRASTFGNSHNHSNNDPYNRRLSTGRESSSSTGSGSNANSNSAVIAEETASLCRQNNSRAEALCWALRASKKINETKAKTTSKDSSTVRNVSSGGVAARFSGNSPKSGAHAVRKPLIMNTNTPRANSGATSPIPTGKSPYSNNNNLASTSDSPIMSPFGSATNLLALNSSSIPNTNYFLERGVINFSIFRAFHALFHVPVYKSLPAIINTLSKLHSLGNNDSLTNSDINQTINKHVDNVIHFRSHDLLRLILLSDNCIALLPQYLLSLRQRQQQQQQTHHSRERSGTGASYLSSPSGGNSRNGSRSGSPSIALNRKRLEKENEKTNKELRRSALWSQSHKLLQLDEFILEIESIFSNEHNILMFQSQSQSQTNNKELTPPKSNGSNNSKNQQQQQQDDVTANESSLSPTVTISWSPPNLSIPYALLSFITSPLLGNLFSLNTYASAIKNMGMSGPDSLISMIPLFLTYLTHQHISVIISEILTKKLTTSPFQRWLRDSLLTLQDTITNSSIVILRRANEETINRSQDRKSVKTGSATVDSIAANNLNFDLEQEQDNDEDNVDETDDNDNNDNASRAASSSFSGEDIDVISLAYMTNEIIEYKNNYELKRRRSTQRSADKTSNSINNNNSTLTQKLQQDVNENESSSSSNAAISSLPSFDEYVRHVLRPAWNYGRRAQNLEAVLSFTAVLLETLYTVNDQVERRTYGASNLNLTIASWENLIRQIRVTLLLASRVGAEDTVYTVENLSNGSLSLHRLLAIDTLDFALGANDSIEHESRCMEVYNRRAAQAQQQQQQQQQHHQHHDSNSNQKSMDLLLAWGVVADKRWRDLIQVAVAEDVLDNDGSGSGTSSTSSTNQPPVTTSSNTSPMSLNSVDLRRISYNLTGHSPSKHTSPIVVSAADRAKAAADAQQIQTAQEAEAKKKAPVRRRRPLLLYFPKHNKPQFLGAYRSLILAERWSVKIHVVDGLALVSDHLFNIQPVIWRAAVASEIFNKYVQPVIKTLVSLEEDPQSASLFRSNVDDNMINTGASSSSNDQNNINRMGQQVLNIISDVNLLKTFVRSSVDLINCIIAGLAMIADESSAISNRERVSEDYDATTAAMHYSAPYRHPTVHGGTPSRSYSMTAVQNVFSECEILFNHGQYNELNNPYHDETIEKNWPRIDDPKLKSIFIQFKENIEQQQQQQNSNSSSTNSSKRSWSIESLQYHISILWVLQLRFQCGLRGIKPSKILGRSILENMDRFHNSSSSSSSSTSNSGNNLDSNIEDKIKNEFASLDPKSLRLEFLNQCLKRFNAFDSPIYVYKLSELWSLEGDAIRMLHINALLEKGNQDEDVEQLVAQVIDSGLVVDSITQAIRIRLGGVLARIDRIPAFGPLLATMDTEAVTWARKSIPLDSTPDPQTLEDIAKGRIKAVNINLPSTRQLVMCMQAMLLAVPVSERYTNAGTGTNTNASFHLSGSNNNSSGNNNKGINTSTWLERKGKCDALLSICNSLGHITSGGGSNSSSSSHHHGKSSNR